MQAHQLVAGLMLLSLAFVPTTVAHDGPAIEVTAPADCPSGDLCIEFASDPPTLKPGDKVDLAFFNDDDTSHTLMVTTGDEADSSHSDTPKSVALATTQNVEAGGSSTENLFDVPEGTSSLYVWCDVPGHESAGMWIEVPVEGGESTNGSPLGGHLAILALAGIALILGRRQL